MADLIYATSMSLDGYVADENGTFDWAAPSAEVHAHFNDLQRAIGTFLCGRRMYAAVSHPRTRLERTFDPAAVRARKARAGRDLAIGGAGLAAEAIRAGLVDRYQLVVVPTIVGGGTRALPDSAKVDLAPQAEHRFADGTVLLDYRTRVP